MSRDYVAALILAWQVGCTTAGEDYYDHIEAGSEWQLSFSTGTLGRESTYTGTCPTFAARTLHVPHDDGAGCDPGSRCSLSFQLEEDEGTSYVSVFFSQDAADYSFVTCDGTHPEGGTTLACSWFHAPTDPQMPANADCEYRLDLVEIR